MGKLEEMCNVVRRPFGVTLSGVRYRVAMRSRSMLVMKSKAGAARHHMSMQTEALCKQYGVLTAPRRDAGLLMLKRAISRVEASSKLDDRNIAPTGVEVLAARFDEGEACFDARLLRMACDVLGEPHSYALIDCPASNGDPGWLLVLDTMHGTIVLMCGRFDKSEVQPWLA